MESNAQDLTEYRQHSAMDEALDPQPPVKYSIQDYRKCYREEHSEFLKNKTKEDIKEILDVIVLPSSIDMKISKGSDPQVATATDQFYAYDGRFLNPETKYPPSMIDHFGKDYALNAQGIYYRNDHSPKFVTSNRKIWMPSITDIDWEEPGQVDCRKRARIFAEHNVTNERWNKSEYAWEADAWSDVFSDLRNDPCLEVDKHDYFINLPKTDPVLCTLTGESTLVKRTPDATFGLNTFSDRESDLPGFASELLRDRLEKLLLYRKCGLLSDPKWGETNLVFPFAVYEAKGWSGDCREARRQACLAAAAYLDLLDDLARRPGPVGTLKPYQNLTSHQYQVFALTSFGAHWHLLVGYRRPREAEEHAGVKGLSDTVYVFQRVWSGRIVDERTAWELLSLAEQIHLWAITEFRAFVVEHLRPWHQFCEENYLMDWDSVYDSGRQLKRKRTCEEGEDLALPKWVNLLSEPIRQRLQKAAKKSLKRALETHRLRKGKGKCIEESESGSGWHCMLDECSRSQETTYDSNEAYLYHLRTIHCLPASDLAQINQCLDRGEEESSCNNEPAFLVDSEPGPSKRIRAM